MDQSTLADFITVVTGFAVIGGLLDAITAKQRLRRPVKISSVSYFEVVYMFYIGFYDRLLPGSPLSRAFIFRSFLLSVFFAIIAHFLIMGPVYGFLNSLNLIQFGHSYTWVFHAVVFVFYVFIFWLVASQTKIFINESVSADSSLSRGIFIVADLISSSNIFIFIFAFSLFFASTIYERTIVLGELLNHDYSVRVDVEKSPFRRDYQENEDREYAYRVKLIRLKNNKSLDLSDVGRQYVIRSNLQYLDPKWFLPNYSNVEWKFLSGDSEHVHNLTSPTDVVDKVSYLESASYNATFSFQHPGLKWSFADYGEAYVLVDSVEDAFWAILDVNSQVHHANRLFNLFGGYDPFFYDELCLYEGFFIHDPDAKERFSGQKGVDCLSQTTIVSGQGSSGRNFINYGAYHTVDFFIPISPYYLSTMFLSLTFYLSVLTVYFFRVARNVPYVSKIVSWTYSTVPFSTMCLFLGMIVWVLAGTN